MLSQCTHDLLPVTDPASSIGRQTSRSESRDLTHRQAHRVAAVLRTEAPLSQNQTPITRWGVTALGPGRCWPRDRLRKAVWRATGGRLGLSGLRLLLPKSAVA